MSTRTDADELTGPVGSSILPMSGIGSYRGVHVNGSWSHAQHDSDRGFTLVELMVVVLIIGILAMVAIASYRDLTARAAQAACLSNQRTLNDAVSIYRADHDGDIPTTTTLDFLRPYANTWQFISVCPLDKSPLSFDASSSSVVCPNHPYH